MHNSIVLASLVTLKPERDHELVLLILFKELRQVKLSPQVFMTVLDLKYVFSFFVLVQRDSNFNYSESVQKQLECFPLFLDICKFNCSITTLSSEPEFSLHLEFL